MSRTPTLRSCDELGICPRRATPCTGCNPEILGQLHRVNTAELHPRQGVSVGACCTHDCNEGRSCPARTTRAPAAGTEHDPAVEFDAPLLRRVLLIYAGTLAACAWATWQWLSR